MEPWGWIDGAASGPVGGVGAWKTGKRPSGKVDAPPGAGKHPALER
jgi:hypothetical protein